MSLQQNDVHKDFRSTQSRLKNRGFLKSVMNLEYNGGKYSIIVLYHQENEIPILLDRDVYKVLKKLNLIWLLNSSDNVYANKDNQTVYLHDLVMKLGTSGIFDKPIKDSNDLMKYIKIASGTSTTRASGKSHSVVHINRINYDNRYVNLQYDIPDKDYVKNTKKKKRTISLQGTGVSVDELPTYVWYLKPDKTHGERFIVDIPNEITWRSTSSKRLSLRYKLEEVKKYMRYLKKRRPAIFDNFSMNGDMSLQGKTLLKEYMKLIYCAKYKLNLSVVSNTDRFIEQNTDGLTSEEIYVLERFDPRIGTIDVAKVLSIYKKN